MSEEIGEERLDQIRRDAASSAVHPTADEVVALVNEVRRHRSRAAQIVLEPNVNDPEPLPLEDELELEDGDGDDAPIEPPSNPSEEPAVTETRGGPVYEAEAVPTEKPGSGT